MDDRSLILVAGAIGAIFGTVITAISNLILASINRRSEERKQLNELMIKAALEQHKSDTEIGLIQARQYGRYVTIPPLKTYVLANFLLVKALSGGGYRVGELEKRLKAMEDDNERLEKALRAYNPDGTLYEPDK